MDDLTESTPRGRSRSEYVELDTDSLPPAAPQSETTLHFAELARDRDVDAIARAVEDGDVVLADLVEHGDGPPVDELVDRVAEAGGGVVGLSDSQLITARPDVVERVFGPDGTVENSATLDPPTSTETGESDAATGRSDREDRTTEPGDSGSDRTEVFDAEGASETDTEVFDPKSDDSDRTAVFDARDEGSDGTDMPASETAADGSTASDVETADTDEPSSSLTFCPACGGDLRRLDGHPAFCPDCGQDLSEY